MPDLMEALAKYVMITLLGPEKPDGAVRDSLMLSIAKQTGEKAVFHRSGIEQLRAGGWEGLEQIPPDQIVEDDPHPRVPGLRMVPIDAAATVSPPFTLTHHDAKGGKMDAQSPVHQKSQRLAKKRTTRP
jgi:hypothetical protein